jgi:hypothetical protein
MKNENEKPQQQQQHHVVVIIRAGVWIHTTACGSRV